MGSPSASTSFLCPPPRSLIPSLCPPPGSQRVEELQRSLRQREEALRDLEQRCRGARMVWGQGPPQAGLGVLGGGLGEPWWAWG